MYLTYQSVIVDVFLIVSYILHVALAFNSTKKLSMPMNALLNKGVTELIFKKIKWTLWLLLILALFITCIITWRFYALLTFLDVSGYGLYIFLIAFAMYSFTFLGAFILCRLMLIAAQRAGI